MENTDKIEQLCRAYLQKRGIRQPLVESDACEADIIVTIPAYNEPNIEPALKSLLQAERMGLCVELLVLVNRSEDNTDRAVLRTNRLCMDTVRSFALRHNSEQFKIFAIERTLLARDAGVGLARKMLMDEALRRLLISGKANGIIAQFDADSQCTRNYFICLEEAFQNPKLDAVSIYFEHDLKEEDIPSEFITSYELHLRYFIWAQRWAGHPYIHHTVGSAMAVRASSYAKFGGMNKRKAGEDFYFLNKIAKSGFVVSLTGAKIVPSGRKSDRVPFGTGRAMLQMFQSNQLYQSYPFESFVALQNFFETVENCIQSDPTKISKCFGQMATSVQEYIGEQFWNEKCEELLKHTASELQLRRRFYSWFDAFHIVKYCNFVRQRLGAVNILDGANELLMKLNIGKASRMSMLQCLELYRAMDRGEIHCL